MDKRCSIKAEDVIVRLCDLVARNGATLSMNPRPDGTFDKGEDLLKGIESG